MGEFLFILVCVAIVWGAIKILRTSKEQGDYNREETNRYTNNTSSDKGTENTSERIKRNSWFSIFSWSRGSSSPSNLHSYFRDNFIPFDKEAIDWCANLLGIEQKILKRILANIPAQYNQFKLRKRSGGYRVISAPTETLLSIQQTIYHRILLPVTIHPAATGFRQGMSILNNARPHLGNKYILKTDLQDFFGSIRIHIVRRAFQQIGYPRTIAEVLSALCCLNRRLPQGAPTSPILSNIISYGMDKKLQALANAQGLIYSRYADDLTFSGNTLSKDLLLPPIMRIIRKEGFALSLKKTTFIAEHRRKIITGISISSGQKLTIPKRKKREMRKNVYFILTKGLAAHQRRIGSTDPAYLKRIIGYLNFWLSVEPENNYVSDSIHALKRLNK